MTNGLGVIRTCGPDRTVVAGALAGAARVGPDGVRGRDKKRAAPPAGTALRFRSLGSRGVRCSCRLREDRADRVPRKTRAAMATTAISARMSAYSARPCPSSLRRTAGQPGDESCHCLLPPFLEIRRPETVVALCPRDVCLDIGQGYRYAAIHPGLSVRSRASSADLRTDRDPAGARGRLRLPIRRRARVRRTREGRRRLPPAPFAVGRLDDQMMSRCSRTSR